MIKYFLITAVSLLFLRPKTNIGFLGPLSSLDLLVYTIVLPILLIMKYYKENFKTLLYFLPVFTYVIIIFILTNFTDIEGVRRFSRSIIDILVSLFLVNEMYKIYEKKTYIIICKIIAISALLQGIVMYLMFFNSDINHFMSILFYKSSRGLITERATGFQSSGGDGLAMNQALGAFVCILLSQKEHKNKFLYIIITLTILGATLLTARSGFVLFIICYSILFLYNFIFEKRRKNAIMIVLICGTAIAFIFPIITEYSLDISRGYQNPITRMLEPFRRYYLSGKFSTSSSNRLSNQVIFPDEEKNIFFGSGQYGREGVTHLNSDIGYIRLLHGIGLLGLTLSFIPFLFLFIKSLLLKRINILLIIVFGFIGNIKIIYLYTGSYISLLFLLYFSQNMNSNHTNSC